MSSQPIDILNRGSRRSIFLHIHDDGALEVRAPRFVPEFIIRRFVSSKTDWIIKTRSKLAARSKSKRQIYREGETIRIGGVTYLIHITQGDSIVIAGRRLFFPERFLKKASYYMELWLKIWAKKFLTTRLNNYAEIMGVAYKKISIRDTSSRWGSCSSTGTISFSYRLILADISIIDYVVIHELSHITHHHHKPAFWLRVAAFYPDYKIARAWLRKEGHTLKI